MAASAALRPRIEDEDDDDFGRVIISPRDPLVVHPPTERQGPPLQSVFIFNPNQPPPPVLATRFFTPPPWPENLEGENLTILPVVGPILALTEEQMETPPGFGRFVPGIDIDPAFGRLGHRREERREDRREDRDDRREDRVEAREERREDREDRRRRRRRRDRDLGGPDPLVSDTSERPTMDWPSGGGAE